MTKLNIFGFFVICKITETQLGFSELELGFYKIKKLRSVKMAGIKSIIILTVILCFATVSLFAENLSPIGNWKTIDDETGEAKSIVKIWVENDELQGKIIELFRKPDEDQNPTCAKGSGELEGKPILGATILHDLKEKGKWWAGGKILDPKKHSEVIQKQTNLIIAKSLFIYLPEFSGIAFLKVSNQIEPDIFAKRFSEIVKESYQNFFMDCAIEMVTDLRSFSVKLSSLDGIYKISAKINPPNPLFGPLWKNLKNYLLMRNTEKMKIEEESPEKTPIDTKLPEFVNPGTLPNSESRTAENN